MKSSFANKNRLCSRICWCLGALCLATFQIPPGYAAERRSPVVSAVEKAGPAVVNIRTEQLVQRRASPFFGFGGSLFEEFFRQFGSPPTYQTQSLGSGMIFDPQGLVLTNAHVIARASKIFIALPNRPGELEATLVGSDERLDLAVLRLPRKADGAYPHLSLGSSSDLLLGETTIAIGNPLGLGSSITTGVVSGPLRALNLSEDFTSVFIQTDALINPGNSGGPLINVDGEVIGINTAIIKQAQGIGFAIPADLVRRVLSDLIENGRPRNSYFGIIPSETGEAFARDKGFGGVLVAEVLSGSPAAQAGLRPADVLLAMDGISVESAGEYLNFLRTYVPGNEIHLKFLRGLETHNTLVRLVAYPSSLVLERARQDFGFEAVEQGGAFTVKAVLRESPAEQVGLQPGDRIAEVQAVRVANLNDYRQVLEENFGRLPLSFLVVRGNRGYYIELP